MIDFDTLVQSNERQGVPSTVADPSLCMDEANADGSLQTQGSGTTTSLQCDRSETVDFKAQYRLMQAGAGLKCKYL